MKHFRYLDVTSVIGNTPIVRPHKVADKGFQVGRERDRLAGRILEAIGDRAKLS